MKKIILFIAVSCLMFQSFGQADTTRRLYKIDYLQKSMRQKKTGYALLGIGGVLVLTSFVIPRGEKIQDGICIFTWCSGDEYRNDQLRGMIGVTGAVAALSSIPFFRASSRNRKKANTLSSFLQIERAPLVPTAGRTTQTFPALAIRWQF